MNGDAYHGAEDRQMNDQQLQQVLDAVEEATVFQPGGSAQLVPAKPLSAAGQKIIDDAVKTCDDIIAAYQEQIDAWMAERARAEEFCTRYMAAQNKLAAEVSAKGAKSDVLRGTFARGIDEHDNEQIQG